MITKGSTIGKHIPPTYVDWVYGNDEGTVKVFSETIDHDLGVDIETYIEPTSGGNQLTVDQWWDNLEQAIMEAVERGDTYIEIEEDNFGDFTVNFGG